MVNFKILFNMYDKYVYKDVLSTQELLELGFNKNDLTRLVAEGKLVRPQKGKYEIGDVTGLLNYSKIRFGKRFHDTNRAKAALNKACNLAPDNGRVQTRVFLSSILDNDFAGSLKSFKVMDETDNKYYKQDQNMWLYLLSFIVELPNEYKERVKNISYDDIKVLSDDKRYDDKVLQDRLRHSVLSNSFRSALSFNHLVSPESKKLGTTITEILLGEAMKKSVDMHKNLYKLVEQRKYNDAMDLLIKEKEIHNLNKADEALLNIVSDLVMMSQEGKAPICSTSYNGNDAYEAIAAKDYSKALSLHKEWLSKKVTFSRSAKVLNKLLEDTNKEIARINGTTLENMMAEDEKKRKKSTASDKMFADIAVCFLNNDLENVNVLISEYLTYVGKDQYKDYLEDLIKICNIDNDKIFSEPMRVLTYISKEEFEFVPADYIQDFYYNLARKDFNKAALYLDILSMSEELGGPHINVGDMKTRLLEDAGEAGYTEEDLGLVKRAKLTDEDKTALLPKDNVLAVSDVMSEVGESSKEELKEVVEEKDEETIVPQEEENVVIEEPSQVTYAVLDVVDKLLEDTNLIMLEPMSEEDIDKVVETTTSFQEIQTFVLEEETGEKRVILKYYDAKGPYVNFRDALRLAGYKFVSGEYEDAIDLYQSTLPKLESPKPFIYARLAEAYEKTENYNKAIDYYTMAEAQSNAVGGEEFDFSAHISELKEKYGYNGVRIFEENQETLSKDSNVQYVKK